MPKALRITAWSLAAVMLVATLAVMGIIGFAHTDSRPGPGSRSLFRVSFQVRRRVTCAFRACPVPCSAAGTWTG